MTKAILILAFTLFYFVSESQPKDVLQTETSILNSFCKKDTQAIKKLVDDQFILVSAEGVIRRKEEFIRAYNEFTPQNNLSLHAQIEFVIDKGVTIILVGRLTTKWKEGNSSLASKSRYTDTYRKAGNKWLLLSSFVNDLVEPYYQLKDTTGIWLAIKKQYEILDMSVENKDLCQHLSLKALDFSTIDGRGNFASPQFMRNRSRILFSALRDSIESNNKVESMEIKDDTVKVIVLQEFNRKQMAGGKVRYFQTLARQRESWMLTREGWKLVFVDRVKALARIIDGIKTEPETPINWNAPPFNQ